LAAGDVEQRRIGHGTIKPILLTHWGDIRDTIPTYV